MGKFEWASHAKDQRVWDVINWAKGQPEFYEVTFTFDMQTVRINIEVETRAGLAKIGEAIAMLTAEIA